MKSLHPISQTPPPARTIGLWKQARWFIEMIWGLFGGPESIADLSNLSRSEHSLLASWLRKAEAYVRKLLVIEAADVRVEEKKYKARAALKREKKLRLYYADEPHNWRVSFRFAVSHADRARVRRGAGANSACLEAWPLAERFEALLRVFDAPEAYVKRVARRLRRNPKAMRALAAPVSFKGFEDVFETLRPFLLDAQGGFLQGDTS